MRWVSAQRAAGMVCILGILQGIISGKCLRPREAGHFPCVAAWVQHPGACRQGLVCYINSLHFNPCTNLMAGRNKEGWNKTLQVPEDFLRGNIAIAFARWIASVNNVVLGKASSSASCFVQ